MNEINAQGGVLDKQPEAVVVDPASDWSLLSQQAGALRLDRIVLQ